MFFWFKRKKIILDCFTDNALVFDRHKIQKASYCFPDWFKGLSNEEMNLKRCPGFKDFFTNAISLNMWCTFDVIVDCANKKWQWETALPTKWKNSSHNPQQYGNFLSPDSYGQHKIDSPWCFKTNRLINFAWVDSFWCRNTHNYFFANAIVNFYYQYGTHVNMFFSLMGPAYNIKIEAGDPLIFLIPLTEDEVEIRNHLVTPQEMERYYPFDVGGSSSSKRYQIRKKHTDKISSQQKKCPLGFGK